MGSCCYSIVIGRLLMCIGCPSIFIGCSLGFRWRCIGYSLDVQNTVPLDCHWISLKDQWKSKIPVDFEWKINRNQIYAMIIIENQWRSKIVIDFQWISMVSHGFQLIFIDVKLIFIDFKWFSLILHRFRCRVSDRRLPASVADCRPQPPIAAGVGPHTLDHSHKNN